MYESYPARAPSARRTVLVSVVTFAALATCLPTIQSAALAEEYQRPPSVIRKISELSERMEITTNSSRILTLDRDIPRVQVNNPELLSVTPLSAKQVQISAKRAGVTQVNLWDEDGNIYTVDVLIYGDAAELEHALKTQYPNSSVKVYRYSESLVLKGFVDRPDHVSQMVRLAEDYAPKVINNISVGGVQQVLLKVRVMEVSRTKLRRLGVDFAALGPTGGYVASSVSGLLQNVTNNVGAIQSVTDLGAQTLKFGIIDGGSAFFGMLDALEQNNIAKILAEPNLVAVSGRPAQFNVGGEIPIVVPQSLGTTSIEFKKFGTQVDFLPIVLGNGNVRLEVRPRISEIDDSRSVVIDSFVIPALTVREVDTAVEMKAGQTFALAGLVQERVERLNRGLPFVSNIPVVGVPFRKVEEEVNEIELLILVTPEFVDAMDPCEVPCGGPGFATTSPSDCDLYCAGKMEVPYYCNPIRGMMACGNEGGCCDGGAMGGCQDGCTQSAYGESYENTPTEVMPMPGGTGYDNMLNEPNVSAMPVSNQSQSNQQMQLNPTQPPATETDADETGPVPMETLPYEMPGLEEDGLQLPPNTQSSFDAGYGRGFETGYDSGSWDMPQSTQQPQLQGGVPEYTVPRPYSRQQAPSYTRNTPNPTSPTTTSPTTQTATPASLNTETGLFGPVGYDEQ